MGSRVDTAGDNRSPNVIISKYTVVNYVLRLRWRVAVKHNFRPYIRRYTPQNEKFEYSYPLIEICYSYGKKSAKDFSQIENL